jgi:hypothetical protein
MRNLPVKSVNFAGFSRDRYSACQIKNVMMSAPYLMKKGMNGRAKSPRGVVRCGAKC